MMATPEFFLTDWQVDDICELLPDFDYRVDDVLFELGINIDVDRAGSMLNIRFRNGYYNQYTRQFYKQYEEEGGEIEDDDPEYGDDD